jgi:hypothetical protein
MATRALVRVIPRQEGLSYSEGHKHVNKALCNMYHHYDGYPEYLGVKLAKFVKDIKITNGLGTKAGKVANGAGCLAASMIAHFKTEAGNVYLHSCEEEEGGWEEYIYTLYPKEGEPTWISIYKTYGDEVIFVGKADKLIKKYAEPVEN